MYIHEYKKRVRYGETDQMGYLYYGRYADLFRIHRGHPTGMGRLHGHGMRGLRQDAFGAIDDEPVVANV